MSSLILYEDHGSRRKRLADFIAPRAGWFEDMQVPGHPGHRLAIWSAERRGTAFHLPLGENDFIALAGSFFYDGLFGEAAARAFHASFNAGRFDWTGTSGHFVMVLAKGGLVHVINDGIAAWKLYTDTARSYVSGGFLEALLVSDTLSFDPQGVYEYAFSGFALGATTFVSEIKAVMPNQLMSLGSAGRITERPYETPIRREPVRDLPIEEMAAYQSEILERRFRAYLPLSGTDMISSISGGFDSRLMVKSFSRAGLRPRLFVYGPPDDPDVVSAHLVADYLGLPLDHVDKQQRRADERPEKPDVASLLFYADGWKDDGLMGFDIDLQDRLERGRRGMFMANGKCGEIYRHYFYQKLPPFGATTKDLVRSCFARPVPGVATDALDTTHYEIRITEAFVALTGFDGRRLHADDLDYLYAKVRMCHDAGRDIMVNHRFSHALYPFVDHDLAGPALAIPYAQKLHGRLEARMIAYQDPGLAALKSAYGYDMLAGPGLAYRLKMAASYLRPAWLRYYLPRLRMRLLPPLGSNQLDVAGLPMLTDPGFPYMQRYFRVPEVRDPLMLSRIAALELLGQHFGFQGPA